MKTLSTHNEKEHGSIQSRERNERHRQRGRETRRERERERQRGRETERKGEREISLT